MKPLRGNSRDDQNVGEAVRAYMKQWQTT
jgi:hypothetical protein